MKKIILILLASTSLVACSKKDDVNPEAYKPGTIMSGEQLPSGTKQYSRNDVPQKDRHANQQQ